MSKSHYGAKVRSRGWLALAGAVAAGAAGSVIFRLADGQWPFWVVFPALLGVVAVAFVATAPWWRTLDHMQKEGQLVSWYWGGIAGAATVLMALVASVGVNSDLARGAMYLFVGQGIAFALYWVGWSWAHRGTEA